MKQIGVNVYSKPVSVNWTCTECYNDNTEPYNEFLAGIEVCDWVHSKVICKECGQEFEIDDIEW